MAAGIGWGSNSSTDQIESSGVYRKTEEAGEATSYAPGATGVVSRHVVEGNNIGAAKDLPLVTNQAGAALSTTNGRVAGSYAGAVRGPTSLTDKAALQVMALTLREVQASRYLYKGKLGAKGPYFPYLAHGITEFQGA